MKQKVWIAALLLIISSLSMEIAAQDNLAALVKKSGTIDSVNVDVVRKRNPETNELQPVVTTITIRSNQDLVNEFLAAFKKDEAKASETVEKKQDGNIIYAHYTFNDISYSLTTQQDNKVIIVEMKGKRPFEFIVGKAKLINPTNYSKEIQKHRIDFEKKSAELRKKIDKRQKEFRKDHRKQKTELRKQLQNMRKEYEKKREELLKETKKESKE